MQAADKVVDQRDDVVDVVGSIPSRCVLIDGFDPRPIILSQPRGYSLQFRDVSFCRISASIGARRLRRDIDILLLKSAALLGTLVSRLGRALPFATAFGLFIPFLGNAKALPAVAVSPVVGREVTILAWDASIDPRRTCASGLLRRRQFL